jgi:hypothetical protein
MSKKIGIDFEEDISINKYNLHEECEIHPSLYHYYSEKLNEAKDCYNTCSDQLRYLIGKKEIKFRKNPPDDIKVTEASIKALLLEDEDIQKKEDELRDWKKKMNTYDSALTSIEHRKSMLNNLVKLYGSGYFSLPDTHIKKNREDQLQDDIRADIKNPRNKE